MVDEQTDDGASGGERNPYGRDNSGRYRRGADLEEVYEWMDVGDPVGSNAVAEAFGVQPRTARKYLAEIAPYTDEELASDEVDADENPYPVRKKLLSERNAVYVRLE